jgi:hypothetical protein
MPNGKCRMHGGRSGGPTGSRNGAYKRGKYSRETKELGAIFRELARAGEALVAVTLRRHGLDRKIPERIRRRRHVRKAIGKANEQQK